MKLIFGFHVPRESSSLETVRYLATHLRETRPLELALGCTWLAILLAMKHVGLRHRRAPAPPPPPPRCFAGPCVCTGQIARCGGRGAWDHQFGMCLKHTQACQNCDVTDPLSCSAVTHTPCE